MFEVDVVVEADDEDQALEQVRKALSPAAVIRFVRPITTEIADDD
jgi:hypothetical protein